MTPVSNLQHRNELLAPAGDRLPIRAGKAPRSFKVCLIRSPTVTTINAVGQDAVPPIGLAYLAGSLKEAGHDVCGVDGVGLAVHQFTWLPGLGQTLMHGLLPEQIVERIPADTEVIGVSTMFSVEWLISREVIRAIRRRFPDRFIVLGGEHVTAVPEYVIKDCPEADVLVLGEGEDALLDLLDARATGRDLATVKGIVYRKDGAPVTTGRRGRLRDVDEIPLPEWSIWPVREYIDNALTHGANLGRTMPILASRGCPYECTFCSNPQMWGTIWRVRKPEAVLAEMKKYMAEYDVTNFDFYDLTAIVKRDWILDFCRMLIAEKMDITWQLPSGTRSEAIDHEVSKALYDSGCRIMNYAPETGSPDELARIKKKVVVDRMIESMRGAHAVGVEIKCNFIFGLPDETWTDVRKTFGFIARLAWTGVEDIAAFPFSPYPGSELFERLRASGRVTLDEAYFKTLLAYTDPEHSVSYCDRFGSKTLTAICVTAMGWFYGLSWILRPRRLLRLVSGYFTGDASTKLMMALSHRKRKHAALNLAKKSGQATVVIPPLIAPRARSVNKAVAGRS